MSASKSESPVWTNPDKVSFSTFKENLFSWMAEHQPAVYNMFLKSEHHESAYGDGTLLSNPGKDLAEYGVLNGLSGRDLGRHATVYVTLRDQWLTYSNTCSNLGTQGMAMYGPNKIPRDTYSSIAMSDITDGMSNIQKARKMLDNLEKHFINATEQDAVAWETRGLGISISISKRVWTTPEEVIREFLEYHRDMKEAYGSKPLYDEKTMCIKLGAALTQQGRQIPSNQSVAFVTALLAHNASASESRDFVTEVAKLTKILDAEKKVTTQAAAVAALSETTGPSGTGKRANTSGSEISGASNNGKRANTAVFSDSEGLTKKERKKMRRAYIAQIKAQSNAQAQAQAQKTQSNGNKDSSTDDPDFYKWLHHMFQDYKASSGFKENPNGRTGGKGNGKGNGKGSGKGSTKNGNPYKQGERVNIPQSQSGHKRKSIHRLRANAAKANAALADAQFKKTAAQYFDQEVAAGGSYDGDDCGDYDNNGDEDGSDDDSADE